MAKAKNKVIAGDYEGWMLAAGSAGVIMAEKWKPITLNDTTVKSYEVITDDHRKSAASGATRGLIGGALLGPVGLLAGGLSAKNKGIYQIAIEFKDGKKSLLEIDDKIYKALIKECFNCEFEVNQNKEVSESSNISAADEIIKFKKLLDDGIITQDEFDTKKQQLLNT